MAPDFSLSIRSLKSPINTCLVIFSIYYGYLLARDIACIFDDTCAYLYPYYALYSIPFSLALLLFFLKRNWQQNGLLVLFSYSLGLYFVSFGIYLFKAAPYWSTDNRNRYEVIMDLRAEGKDAWPIASPGNYIEDPHIPFKQKNILPLTSISNATIAYCNESGEYLVYQSDEYGYRNPQNIWPDTQTPLDIVIVGDSFSQGACVQDGQDVASHLRKYMPRTVTMGFGGSSAMISYAQVKEATQQYPVKHLIWMVYEGNDLEELLNREMHNPILNQYLKQADFTQRSFAQHAKLETQYRAYVSERMDEYKKRGYIDRHAHEIISFSIRDLLLLKHLREAAAAYTHKSSKRALQPIARFQEEGVYQLYDSIVRAMKEHLDLHGVSLTVVYLPSWKHLHVPHESDQEIYRILTKTFLDHDVELIDIYEIFRAHPDSKSLFYYPSSHYNVQGYQLVADSLLAAINQ